jgi:hypothetical protein
MQASNPAIEATAGKRNNHFCNIVNALLGSGGNQDITHSSSGTSKASQMVSRQGSWLAEHRRLVRKRSSRDPERLPVNVVSVLFRPMQHARAHAHT